MVNPPSEGNACYSDVHIRFSWVVMNLMIELKKTLRGGHLTQVF